MSVVLPILNGEPHLSEQLAALSAQTYRGAWELIAVDNGCTDASMGIVESFRGRVPSLVVVDATRRRGLGHARNAGADAARGELLAFCDADDVAAPDWLEALADGAALGDVVGGSIDFRALNNDVQRVRDAAEPIGSLLSGYGFLPYPSGGNCAVWADVAREIRWDESFRFGASDIEFGWRVQLGGYRVAFLPSALMRVRLRGGSMAVARQYFRYGVSEPHLFRRFRGHGMPPSDLGQALRTWGWLARNSIGLLRTPEGRGRWLRVAAKRSGRLYGSLRWQVPFL